MAKSIHPPRGLFLCLALAVGILGCQPTNQIDPSGVDPSSSTGIKRTPRPSASVTTTPEATLAPGETPTPSPTPTPNPLGIVRVAVSIDTLTSAEGGNIPGPTYNYSLLIKPPDSKDWDMGWTYPVTQNGNIVRLLYPSLVKQAYLAKVEMSNSEAPGDTELTLTLPNGKSSILSAGQTYTLGSAPFDDLTNCTALSGVTITTTAATEDLGLGQTRPNGIRVLVNSSGASANVGTDIFEALHFRAVSVKARDNGATDILPQTFDVYVTNTGELPIVVE
ncbi:MAG: hypothetical protein ACM3YO_03010 [Bacteroidota bacterium]